MAGAGADGFSARALRMLRLDRPHPGRRSDSPIVVARSSTPLVAAIRGPSGPGTPSTQSPTAARRAGGRRRLRRERPAWETSTGLQDGPTGGQPLQRPSDPTAPSDPTDPAKRPSRRKSRPPARPRSAGPGTSAPMQPPAEPPIEPTPLERRRRPLPPTPTRGCRGPAVPRSAVIRKPPSRPARTGEPVWDQSPEAVEGPAEEAKGWRRRGEGQRRGRGRAAAGRHRPRRLSSTAPLRTRSPR